MALACATGSVLSLDASWLSEARWNALTDDQRNTFPPLCPEFVIEVLSVSDSRPVLRAKMQAWIANGAQPAWMIDPRAGEFSIYRPGQQPEVLLRPESVAAESRPADFAFAPPASGDDT